MPLYKKVVINKCYGGFGISEKAKKRYEELTKTTFKHTWDLNRDDPILIQVIEELGEEANDELSKLKIVEIPENVEYYIDDYDGIETIHEKHEEWG